MSRIPTSVNSGGSENPGAFHSMMPMVRLSAAAMKRPYPGSLRSAAMVSRAMSATKISMAAAS